MTVEKLKWTRPINPELIACEMSREAIQDNVITSKYCLMTASFNMMIKAPSCHFLIKDNGLLHVKRLLCQAFIRRVCKTL